jgi:hypothetical protein
MHINTLQVSNSLQVITLTLINSKKRKGGERLVQFQSMYSDIHVNTGSSVPASVTS